MLDEIAFDKTEMFWDDDPLRLDVFDSSSRADFIVPRMRK